MWSTEYFKEEPKKVPKIEDIPDQLFIHRYHDSNDNFYLYYPNKETKDFMF